MGTIAGCLCQMNLLPVSFPERADALDQPRCLHRGECIVMRQVQMGKKTNRELLFRVSLDRNAWGKSSVTMPSEADRETSTARLQHFRSLKVHSWSFARWKSMASRIRPSANPARVTLEQPTNVHQVFKQSCWSKSKVAVIARETNKKWINRKSLFFPHQTCLSDPRTTWKSNRRFCTVPSHSLLTAASTMRGRGRDLSLLPKRSLNEHRGAPSKHCPRRTSAIQHKGAQPVRRLPRAAGFIFAITAED